MAPSGRPRTRRTATAARKPKRRTTQIKKRTNPSRKEEKPADLSPKMVVAAGAEAAAEADGNSGGCSTPKGRQFEIPEVMTCPPAPKKRRALSNCSLRRSPIAFFAPPDIELFFFMALRRDIPV